MLFTVKPERCGRHIAHTLPAVIWLASIAIGLMLLLAACGRVDQSMVYSAAQPATGPKLRAEGSQGQPLGPATIVPTPFRPLEPTQIVTPILDGQTQITGGRAPTFDLSAPGADTRPSALGNLIPAPRSSLSNTGSLYSSPSNSAANEPTLNFYGINFDRHERVNIEIIPPNGQVNRGKAIKISFIPGERCQFGDKKGCVYAYKPTYAGNVIVITIHSGVGGEGQRLRGALEGTGINRAGYSLKKVRSNMQALSGAQIVIQQGDVEIGNLQLSAVTRIPPRSLTRYFRASLAEILELAADLDPGLSSLVHPEQPQIILETCGWKMPGEPGSENVSDTTGSVYLAIIH